ncbi:hypothetical protein B0H66DRAFT_560170, partial [Apodospora peruviana]
MSSSVAAGAPGGGGGGGGGEAGAVATVFERVLDDFKTNLKPKDQANFKKTTMKDLLLEIDQVQKTQYSQRRLQASIRLKPTLEAITQLGKVVEVFANSSEFVAFVWGPMKFLVQTASTFADAFTELLDVYEEIGERLPMVLQYENLFHDDAKMVRALGFLYKDVLEFHRRALKYFQQPMWRQLFQATWKTYKSRFTKVIGDINQHSRLIESRAALAQILATEKDKVERDAKLQSIIDKIQVEGTERKIQDVKLQAVIDANEARLLRDLHCWLRAVNVQNDQHHFSKIRADYPGTGRWLLDNATFKEWFEPLCQVIPPLLWLNGIPGAGKTILASLVVEEARKLPSSPTVLYFYCKHGDNERDNFISISRSLLSQLLSEHRDTMLSYYQDKYSKSNEAVLSTYSTIEELLSMAIRNCQSAYIILDGIDECPRKEREIITTWFRELVEGMPPANQDSIRCLFVSQDDGVARKDFADLRALKIRTEDSRQDVDRFSAKGALNIQKRFKVTDEKRDAIALRIKEAAGGMFLLAKLISSNLLHQKTVRALDFELEPGRFPKEINTAYGRIIARIFDQASTTAQEDSRTLLAWLACAKRSLKWHEIQGAKSIFVHSQSVDLASGRFVEDSKDLCGSLVEIRADGTVELVHLTAKMFLVTEKHVDQPRAELELSSLCVNYLNFPGFKKHELQCTKDLVQSGYYAFMDYAVAYWVRHLETALVSFSDKNDQDIQNLAESLEVFIELHYQSQHRNFPISHGNRGRLQCFEDMSLYHELLQAVISTRKQLTFYGEMKPTEIALDLLDVVGEVRRVLEELLRTANAGDELAQSLEESYGSNLFKCPRLSCRYFSNGFATAEQRDQHLDKHQRPFHCTVTGCPSFAVGFGSEKDLEKHVQSHAVMMVHDEDQFPESEEEEESEEDEDQRLSRQQTLQEIPTNGNAEDENEVVAPFSDAPEDEGTKADDEQPQTKTQERTQQKRKRGEKGERQKNFACQTCPKTFTRKYNYTSHLRTHSTDKPFVCQHSGCARAFARYSDFKRHELVHAGRGFACWGCGKAFGRSDTLANHHKSKKGERCLAFFDYQGGT